MATATLETLKSAEPLTLIVASTELTTEELRKRRERLQKIFDDDELNFEFFIASKSREIEVRVERGDWKHDHGHLDYIMEKNGYMKLGEHHFGEDTGDDSYSSTHVYLQKEA